MSHERHRLDCRCPSCNLHDITDRVDLDELERRTNPPESETE